MHLTLGDDDNKLDVFG